MEFKIASVVLLGLSLTACGKAPEQSKTTETQPQSASTASNPAMEVSKDYHSFANPEQIKVTHLDLDLDVDFSQHIISGDATIQFQRIEPNASTLILDTRDLSIERVTAMGQDIPFTLADADPHLGAALSIEVPAKVEAVTVSYHTSPQASGVQWLTPEQTAGKQQPFLFTQAQAIHARSFIPLQDSPQVRVTYQATVRTPAELLAVMSASNDPATERDGEYHFSMPQPIPSYLIALAVGDLAFKPMGERTGVYAEPSMLEAAAKEFEDTEAMLNVTEKKFGKYRWDRYDLLILPPSFPFGGMENPRLSFITPTVIAGDKSLVSLIAHELAHSWSGNTVTNATWRDLWLNEGFTTYLTYRIMEMIYGPEREQMEFVLGQQSLQADIASLPAADQMLAIDLRGRDPDDVFSDIPYEKGALFARELEQKVGRDAFDKFLMGYFEHFAFQSITTDQFIAYLNDTLLKEHAEKLDAQRIQQWIFEPGVPEGAPMAHSDAFTKVDAARDNWLAGELKAEQIDTANWNTHQWLHFLNNMPESLSQAQMTELDNAFALTQVGNNEIAHSWLLMSVNNWYEPAFSRLHDYLVHIGRNKLVKPLYQALSKTEKGKAFAKQAFTEAKPGYHPLTVKANEGYVE
ncbi:leukotriene A4 hydrolase C-terminal domain-containing protein [Bowmanella sp. Y26]|uniref:M1 family metallopeptidase n=1 Tax=Bowmanella yangjiangensis TaxID=2811230 RepID=UPI001BDBBE7B|nr:M1 family metallopeptidase [Bowmanella yangjiangensis]MBT1065420.1 leukotriene A4 hydrolase C-terminal domain-containing protein [Bowmanella yangjiangensis]